VLAERARSARAEPGGARTGARRDRAEARAATAPLRARLREIEAELEKLGREGALIEKRLADPATYARFKGEDIAWAQARRAAIAKGIAALEEEWLELAARLEAAQSQPVQA
jgi:ATP-binding cassette subfamily F protein 3